MEIMSLCLFHPFWSDSHPKSANSFSMLHNLVAPMMIRVASFCIESSCFLGSTDALFHTESQYSNSGRTENMYICSHDLRLTLNFSARSRLSLVQAIVVIA